MVSWETIASIATAIGVGIAASQILQERKLAQTAFEDNLDRQYRTIAKEIPVDALIGKEIPEAKKIDAREAIFNYLDLCNEEIFLRKQQRISKEKWQSWCSGIKTHLENPAFKEVWEEVKTNSPSSFSFLEQLEKQGFKTDPIDWKKNSFN